MDTFLNYPHLTYNQIDLNIIEKYNLKKLSFTNNSFNIMKTNYKKIIKINVLKKIKSNIDVIKLICLFLSYLLIHLNLFKKKTNFKK